MSDVLFFVVEARVEAEFFNDEVKLLVVSDGADHLNRTLR